MTITDDTTTTAPKPSAALFGRVPPVQQKPASIVVIKTETPKPAPTPSPVMGVELGRREILLDLTNDDLKILGPWVTKHLTEDVPSGASTEKCKNVGIALKQARELFKKRSRMPKKVTVTEVEGLPSPKKVVSTKKSIRHARARALRVNAGGPIKANKPAVKTEPAKRKGKQQKQK